MCRSGAPAGSVFLVAADCHPQTIAVVPTRGRPVGIEVRDAAGELRAWRRRPGASRRPAAVPRHRRRVDDLAATLAAAARGRRRCVVAPTCWR
ncbi:MAG: hypothetical protein KatS3mg103_0456 [Phycisphaerales bacterium]|nr:MAG: hypothetical protein KatS3mg103_0456 [Phycisphaerales bacterium]